MAAGYERVRVLLDERVASRAVALERARQRMERAGGPGSWYAEVNGTAEPLYDPPVTWTVEVLVDFGEDGPESDQVEVVTVEAVTETEARRAGTAAVRLALGDAAPEPFRSRDLGAQASR